jgi:SAM-dependent methyltransferase
MTAETAYVPNADFWIRVIRENLDRYRTELTDRVILDAVDPAPGETIIDAGCGEGWLSRACTEAGAQVVGVDNCLPFIEAARSASNGTGPVYHHADVQALPLEDASADVVVANHVLTDVPDPAKAINEFARVLRPGGRFVTLMLHPCFYGPQAERRVDAPQANVIEYFARPRIVRQPFVIAGQTSPAEIVTHLWPLEFWFESLFTAGLIPTSVTEPHPSPEQMADPWWHDNFRRPLFLLIDARRGLVVPPAL